MGEGGSVKELLWGISGLLYLVASFVAAWAHHPVQLVIFFGLAIVHTKLSVECAKRAA
jgi:hypothetical protein